MPDIRPMVAGRYRLDSRIAAGGMGEVWRAVDTVLDRPVAVKLLRAEYAGHAETLARFRAEARHAGALTHPAIARVYDYGETGSGHPPYLVMELVEGPALIEVLSRGPLDAARTMDVICQVAAGLHAAHSAGLVHRDIKPGNLLIGPGGQVKITDFGISHAGGSAPITRTGMLIGTPAYLAPERVTGGSASPVSDLYSLGIVAWECLTGAAPFTGQEMDVALAHRDLALPPLPPGVPTPAAALVAEMTAKDPGSRPATAGDVARRAGQLRDALAGPPRQSGGWPGQGDAAHAEHKTATLSAPHAITLTGEKLPDDWLDPPRRRRGTTRRGLVGVAAVGVAAALAGWLLFGGLSPAASHRHTAARRASPAVTRATTIAVSGDALIGQPVRAVRQQLHKLGLRVQVTWQPSHQQPPATVLSVQPTGQVPAGSTIVLTAAFGSPGPDGHGHGHGQGGGDGHGNGGGGGNGGGSGD